MDMLPQKRKSSDQAGPSQSLPKLDETPQERSCAGHFENLGKSFERLKADKEMCDFTIKVEEEEIHAHRVVLVAASKYFEAMFRHDSQEAQTGIVRMRDIEPAAVKQCIDFIYTGKVQFTTENPQHLIYAAELMQLTSLTDLYFGFLKQEISAKNCLKYVILAETYNKRSFANFFKDFSVGNFSGVVDSEDFLSISLSLLKHYVASSPSSPTLSEMKKWEAISKWVNAELDSRLAHFEELFLAINLDNVPDNFLREKVLPDPLIRDSMTCQKHILDAALTPNRIREYDFSKEGSYLVTCNVESRLLQCMDVNTKKFSRITRIPEDIFPKIVEIVSVKRDIFLISSDAIYKVEQDKIVKVHSLNTLSGYYQCVVHRKFIFIIERGFLGIYDTTGERFGILEKPLDLGEGFFVATSDTHIYAMGGRGTESKAREFAFSTLTWQPISSMVEKRCFGAAVYVQPHVMVFGGNNGEDSKFVEYYSPDSNTWKLIDSPDEPEYIMNTCKAFKQGSEVWMVRERTANADGIAADEGDVSLDEGGDSADEDDIAAGEGQVKVSVYCNGSIRNLANVTNVTSAQLACMVYSE